MNLKLKKHDTHKYIYMLTREDLQEISLHRLEEAKILYKQGQYDGAKYLLGYTLETALKARICKFWMLIIPTKAN